MDKMTTDHPLFKIQFKAIHGKEFDWIQYANKRLGYEYLVRQALAAAEEMLKFGEECYKQGYDYRCSLDPVIIKEFGTNSIENFNEYIKSLTDETV